MSSTVSGSTALPQAPALPDAGPIRMPGGVLIANGTPVPATSGGGGTAAASGLPPALPAAAASPAPVAVTAATPAAVTMPSAVAGATGGGSLVQASVATSTAPAAATSQSPMQVPTSSVAGVNGGGGSGDLTQVIAALQQAVAALGQLVTQLQANGPSTPPPVTGGGDPGQGPSQAPPASGGCTCAHAGASQVQQAPPAKDAPGKDAPGKETGGKDKPKDAPPKDAGKVEQSGGPTPSAKGASRAEIDAYIKHAAGVYGVDAGVLSKIAELESGYRIEAVNDYDINARRGTPSKGMFQFIEPTFDDYAKKAKAANPQAWAGLGELNWLDWRQQALATAWAIKNGHGSAWATFKRAGG